ncbi:hypothetical protein EW145_g8526, partial [Phellinidium pouzarii]
MTRADQKAQVIDANNKRATEITSQKNVFVCWESSNGKTLCTNDQCTYPNKEITAGQIVMVRPQVGARSPDGIVPTVYTYQHLGCVTKYALARLQNPDCYHLSKYLDDEQEEEVKETISGATIWALENPKHSLSNQEINAPLAKSQLSKRQVKKLFRTMKKAPAAYHAEHTALAKDLKHKAEKAAKIASHAVEKKLQADIRMAKAEAAKAKADLQKAEQDLKEAKKKAEDSTDMANRLTALLGKSAQRNLSRKIKKKLVMTHQYKLHRMANFDTMQLHTLIMRTHEAISKDDGIKNLIVEAIEKEHPGEGNVYIDKLGKKVMDGPFGYIAQCSRGVGDERVLKSVEEKFSLLEKNVDWGDSDSEDEGDKG